MHTKFIYALLLALSTQAAQALDMPLEPRDLLSLDVGSASSGSDGFDSAQTQILEFSHRFNNDAFRFIVDRNQLGEFKRKSLQNTAITLDGYSLGIGKTLKRHRSLFLEAAVQALRYRQESKFLNFDLGSKHGNSLALGLKAKLKLNGLSFSTALRQYFDVAGEDITVITFGVDVHLDNLLIKDKKQ